PVARGGGASVPAAQPTIEDATPNKSQSPGDLARLIVFSSEKEVGPRCARWCMSWSHGRFQAGLASLRSGEVCFARLAGGNMSGRSSIGLLGSTAWVAMSLPLGCSEHVNDIGAIGSPTDAAFLPEVMADSAEEALPPADAQAPCGAVDSGWHLLFEDQFEGVGAPNADFWKLEIGPADDHQRQYNTDRPENIRL